MLLLLVTGKQGQAICVLFLDGMTVTTTSCQLQLLSHTKTSKPDQKWKPLAFNANTPDLRPYPLSTLKEYIQRTKPPRNTEKQLFISFIRPRKTMSQDTISRRTKDVVKLSVIDITIFAAHSTRAATASKANAKNVPLDVILRTIGWASAQTFSKFYNKPVATENTMVDAVLSSETKNRCTLPRLGTNLLLTFLYACYCSLLLLDGANAFVPMIYFNNGIKAGQQAPNWYCYCDLLMTESCLIKQHILFIGCV